MPCVGSMAKANPNRVTDVNAFGKFLGSWPRRVRHTPGVPEIRLASNLAESEDCFTVRYEVFVTEQGVPAALERDEQDEHADHFVAYDEGKPVGAGRLVVEPAGFEGIEARWGEVGHLGRLAVRAPARGSGLGVALVQAIEARAVSRGLSVMALSSQTYAIPFYERLGYAAQGDEFDDAGLPHRWMTRRLP
jgi:predicted GNAT family N-acyltransferase